MKKAICLDFGNVLVSWHPPDEVIRDIVRRYGGNSVAAQGLFSKEPGEKRWERLELGGITIEEFWQSVCKISRIDQVSLPLAEFAPLYVHDLRPIEPMVELVRKAGEQGYQLIGISNCDKMRGRHIVNFLESFHEIRFLEVFISSETGVKKPDLIQYALAKLQEKHGLSTAECVFIDDVPEYVEAARRIGLDAVLFNAITERINVLTKKMEVFDINLG